MKKKVDALKLRKSLGLNQGEFWGRLEVTQSGGSRYENGRSMPRAVRKLLGIVYLKEKP
jgi:transcriptional regulator with XRE-family HTH domain